jgi:hypothetical protein
MAEILYLPQIEVFNIDSIEHLGGCLPHRGNYFTMLLAWDAPEIEQDKLINLLQPLVDRGLAYFCAWGNKCSEMHDAVDLCAAKREQAFGPADYLLMTTWHDDEPLEEALWFFEMCAIPSEDHVLADLERFAVAVGNSDWAVEMERMLAQSKEKQEEIE